MSDGALLLALQHGDSFFPSGAIAFSWGLEGLCRDGLVRDHKELLGFVEGQLLGRWRTCDRPAVLAAYRARGDLRGVTDVDLALDALTLPTHLREGSRRCGAALLSVHYKLDNVGAAPYRALVRAEDVPGHLAAVQGLLWYRAGVAEASVAAMSAHSLVIALLGAAVRLAVIGHIDAQRILMRCHPLIEEAAMGASPNVDEFSSYTPAAEIAAMRHESRDSRLFFN